MNGGFDKGATRNWLGGLEQESFAIEMIQHALPSADVATATHVVGENIGFANVSAKAEWGLCGRPSSYRP